MFNSSSDIFFAAVGDVHGEMYAMLRLLQAWESRTQQQLAFVLQVGDFEPHRNEADLATMAAPSRYRKLGDFPDFYSGKTVFPWQVYFIGGNHEPYGFLDLTPEGGKIADNCYYLGRVGSVELAGLKIVGVSGIYQEDLFTQCRPSIAKISSRSRKKLISFTEAEISQAMEMQSADILLLHEWAQGIIAPEDEETIARSLPPSRSDGIGNEYAKILIDLLQPQLVLCGHMHLSYRNQIQVAPGKFTEICCLNKVAWSNQDAIAIFRLTADGQIWEEKI
ncbi:metallophosphoesterase [Oscillatoria salina]|uniref:metallophosphoesterase n=1 Tax=Oscillatoria salina TaxID=331517 RepID=UPI0013B9ABCB|nr:metallophosphoesterase [Oscillatoria salina]MBZ8181892.1 metallophosphoesterase [Oscillatoria salina IIICB1]NET89215.1 metallophosphoesterase [Kamptonema sp. SIO1D9]